MIGLVCTVVVLIAVCCSEGGFDVEGGCECVDCGSCCCGVESGTAVDDGGGVAFGVGGCCETFVVTGDCTGG